MQQGLIKAHLTKWGKKQEEYMRMPYLGVLTAFRRVMVVGI